MRSVVLFFVAAVSCIGLALPAWGHGPQIQLTAEAGKIVTRQVMIDVYAPITPATSIYVLPITSHQWQVQPPGTIGSGPGIAPGVGFVDEVSHPFKSGNYTTSIVDGLKKWNGASFVDAGDVQLQLFKTVSGNPLTATTTDSGPFASLTYPLTIDSEEAHTGMGFRFLGDGVSNLSVPPEGVYLLSLKVSNAGLTESDPFYFVLSKGILPKETADVAFAYAQQRGISADAIQNMLIPEPTSLAIAALALCGIAAARRRVRNNEA